MPPKGKRAARVRRKRPTDELSSGTDSETEPRQKKRADEMATRIRPKDLSDALDASDEDELTERAEALFARGGVTVEEEDHDEEENFAGPSRAAVQEEEEYSDHENVPWKKEARRDLEDAPLDLEDIARAARASVHSLRAPGGRAPAIGRGVDSLRTGIAQFFGTPGGARLSPSLHAMLERVGGIPLKPMAQGDALPDAVVSDLRKTLPELCGTLVPADGDGWALFGDSDSCGNNFAVTSGIMVRCKADEAGGPTLGRVIRAGLPVSVFVDVNGHREWVIPRNDCRDESTWEQMLVMCARHRTVPPIAIPAVCFHADIK